jgi:DNA replication protein DnaC
LAGLAGRLGDLGLKGMAQALMEEAAGSSDGQHNFLDGLEKILAREESLRQERRRSARLHRARRPQEASLEALEQPAPRGLEADSLARLKDCSWMDGGRNLLLYGAVGAGKTYLACALARQVCLAGQSALYVRLPELLETLAAARRQGRWAKVLAAHARPHLLVLDDWGLSPLQPGQLSDLLELAEARHAKRSTLIATSVSEEDWPGLLPPGLPAQALLDRWLPGALRLALRGGSRRG